MHKRILMLLMLVGATSQLYVPYVGAADDSDDDFELVDEDYDTQSDAGNDEQDEEFELLIVNNDQSSLAVSAELTMLAYSVLSQEDADVVNTALKAVDSSAEVINSLAKIAAWKDALRSFLTITQAVGDQDNILIDDAMATSLATLIEHSLAFAAVVQDPVMNNAVMQHPQFAALVEENPAYKDSLIAVADMVIDFVGRLNGQSAADVIRALTSESAAYVIRAVSSDKAVDALGRLNGPAVQVAMNNLDTATQNKLKKEIIQQKAADLKNMLKK